jgi:hypothetical protein
MGKRTSRRPKNQKARKTCKKILDTLTQSEINQLAAYAARRLRRRLGPDRTTVVDPASEALLRMIRGLQNGHAGRRPRLKNVRNKDAFMSYWRSVINSLVETEARKREHQSGHESLEQLTAEGEAGKLPECLAVDLQRHVFLDLKIQLFGYLRQKAPRHLQLIRAEWEMECEWVCTIPLNGRHRSLRAQLRACAKIALRYLGESDF